MSHRVAPAAGGCREEFNLDDLCAQHHAMCGQGLLKIEGPTDAPRFYDAGGIEITAESELVLRTLGEHMFNRYVEIKRQEWEDYRVQVSAWELERYLPIL